MKSVSGLVIECDELCSFVGNKRQKQWLWLALDRATREVVGAYIGSCGIKGAQAYGIHCPVSTKKMPWLIPTSGKPTKLFSQKTDIAPLARKVDKPTTLNGSTAYFASGFQDWQEKPYIFRI